MWGYFVIGKQFCYLPSRASLKRLVTGDKRFSIDIDALRAIGTINV
jgi:hypothetical protein